jgi:hypothetical protein
MIGRFSVDNNVHQDGSFHVTVVAASDCWLLLSVCVSCAAA